MTREKYADDRPRKLISPFKFPGLKNSDLEGTDIFGKAVE
jgi:hypothetical protein